MQIIKNWWYIKGLISNYKFKKATEILKVKPTPENDSQN
jgi:hypothetical protein